jgi:hypothetical protein
MSTNNGAFSNNAIFGNNSSFVDPNSSTFTVGNNLNVNDSGWSHTAYLFGHYATSTGRVYCGSYTAGNGSNVTVTVGWRPRFVLIKDVNSGYNWVMFDDVRGVGAGGTDRQLIINTTAQQSTVDAINFTDTGFVVTGGNTTVNDLSHTILYMAIR